MQDSHRVRRTAPRTSGSNYRSSFCARSRNSTRHIIWNSQQLPTQLNARIIVAKSQTSIQRESPKRNYCDYRQRYYSYSSVNLVTILEVITEDIAEETPTVDGLYGTATILGTQPSKTTLSWSVAVMTTQMPWNEKQHHQRYSQNSI